MKAKMKLVLSILTVLLLAIAAFGQTERDQGIELYLQGDYNNAISVLDKVVEIDKKNREAWFYLGLSFARTKP